MTASGDREGDRGATLLGIARWGLEESVLGVAPGADWGQIGKLSWLQEQGASFVTLEKGGALRGCIGTLYAWRPLGEDVRANARGAALEDPRFPAVAPDELGELEVEVSVLSKPEPLEVANREALLAALRPGVDGLIVEHGSHRATYLPQVWEGLSEPDAFVRQLLKKAGLAQDPWPDDAKWSTYRVEKFGP